MNPLMRIVEALKRAINPPSKMSLSEWADKHAVLSAESSAEAGRWKTLPYQKGIMDAITDPRIERVSVKKSARVGYTKILNHALAYHIHQDPCSMMVVQPTIEDAEGYSKEEIAPMLRDTPALKDLVIDAKLRDGTNSILHKLFPGGQLSLVGANSPRGFRRVSRRLVAFDETSAYPASSGSEGSPIKLGIKRTEYFWNRKIIDGSTPGLEGTCAIDRSFQEGDQRRRFLPCPECGHMQFLKFEHIMWPEGEPEKAYYACEENGCVIQHGSLRWMDERGEWRATNPTTKNKRHASFHIWAAYSYSPNSTWADIAREFLDCKKDPELLKTFINTVLGETWQVKGEKPDHMRLYERREPYGFNNVPKEVAFLTVGADVQKDRIEFEVVGWGRDKQSWSIDYRVIVGETHTTEPWTKLSELLNETWRTEDGRELQVRTLAVDSGFNTQHVYDWVRKHSSTRVRAIKGQDSLQMTYAQPRDIDLNKDGSKLRRASKVWPVGVSVIKSELYAWLKLDGAGDSGVYSGGFCHFPEYEEEYFKRLCSEQLIKKTIGNRSVYQWVKVHERNEALDCRVYARAAAAMFGLDLLKDYQWDSFFPKAREAVAPKPNPASRATPTPRRTAEQDDYWARQRAKGKI